jgi:hypothetical protein
MRAAVKRCAVGLALTCGCGPSVVADGTNGSTGEAESTGSASASVSATDPGGDPTSQTTASTTVMTTSDRDTGIDPDTGVDPDGDTTMRVGCLADQGGGPRECDQWVEDCPCGEKCMPFASDGGNAWNDLMCIPVARDAKGVGEPCTVQGDGVSGIDDCGIHSMCWNVDPDTSMGTCVAFCEGTVKEPFCEEECSQCTIANDGVLTICLPHCDALVQDCADDEVCVQSLVGFACMNAGENAGVGDDCEYWNSCAAGLYCAAAPLVPSCGNENGCCTPFCDTTVPDSCAGGPEGTTCVPWTNPTGCDSPTLGVCVQEG